jgi:16S rRNA (adenine1518-N6/adenine1519-N6)-dimethyltransferase
VPRLKKKWGQHHLTSGHLCAPLVEFLRPAGERVVEIGPGGGVLSDELLAAGAAVVGWEIDLDWAFSLAGRFPLVAGDALEISWPDLARCGPVLAAGNLPYNVATPIVERLLPHREAVPRAGFMVQKEVADRLVAGPGDADYGYLSVIVAAYADARLLGVVRRGAFRPPPKVDGAFIGLTLKEPPLPDDEMPAFRQTVSAAFALRRKTLRNSLASAWGRQRAAHAISAAGLDDRVRAETLGLAELVKLYRSAR